MTSPIVEIAIIVCTYNPDAAVFSRTLNAIAALKMPDDIKIECVLVDNNSSIAIAELTYVQAFLAQCSWATVIREPQQGLTFARLCGVRSTTAEILVFIDDDNEPASDYLIGVQYCFQAYPSVAVWGPGRVKVDFLAPVSPWFDRNFRGKFQEKNVQHTEYGCVFERWAEFYPPGTGMSVKRDVMEQYERAISEGVLASTDRQGRSLSSGGDVQIVWEAVKMGLAAGVSPQLQMTHLIPGQRATLDYVTRLTFGTASSYMPAVSASFGWTLEKVAQHKPSHRLIVKNILKLIVQRLVKFNHKRLRVDLAKYVGQVIGVLRVVDTTDQHWLYKVVKVLNFE
ncbi:glycosyl transferase, group 2 family protein [Leptolyngbya boryana NIES-2135]|jgi:glycosyltransferase involved in cell wall biosynthesis|uniref:Glycosyl transferase, group 2 family protein n=1 Tax=Leptolyngbya boryana NIES-2135 TaxID=1973484 RepID=A0A1Z4JBM4_LEPBY|nr:MULTISPECIES: glycosyltransferase [Leptolyngbya]BAY54100.1 glycosyl transferase, group 2 family protein [Leptolyngbya boryana NIES-2135]MBD2369756.1 glycosyltransferase family 2 protein [Leptolyngbya sp. FACHB-161]MBD2376043.1 glycosyltransferase family 2 protein [Leptolyngbya sp. FACHB-238]MBD2400319.1 glycosyltransferase family 2 protein [Leptolyngbya sp. FACHB-239]MBD2406860.1 glycosyltransferase family 2 protein [Leptolyngbya sp. FACHB-402]